MSALRVKSAAAAALLLVAGCALDYILVFTFIPFWPGCANVEVLGDMVRFRRDAPPPSVQQATSSR